MSDEKPVEAVGGKPVVEAVDERSRAIIALMECGTVSGAAEALGVSRQTLWRWSKEPAFQAQLLEAKREANSAGLARLQNNLAGAVQTLEEIMRDPQLFAGARVHAAKAVLYGSIKAREIEDMEVRIKAVERQLQEEEEKDKAAAEKEY